MANNDLAITREEAMELLAFLISSAQVCLREPYQDGPYRLISAAASLARYWAPRADREGAVFLTKLADHTDPAAAQRNQDPARFEAYLSECARGLAAEIRRQEEFLDGP